MTNPQEELDELGADEPAPGPRIAGIEGHNATHYPLSLATSPGPRLALRLDYRPDVVDRVAATEVFERLKRVLVRGRVRVDVSYQCKNSCENAVTRAVKSHDSAHKCVT